MTHQSLSLYSLGLAPPGPAMRYAPHQPSAAAQLCAIAPAEPGTLEPGPPPPPKVAHPHSRHEQDARESPPPPRVVAAPAPSCRGDAAAPASHGQRQSRCQAMALPRGMS